MLLLPTWSIFWSGAVLIGWHPDPDPRKQITGSRDLDGRLMRMIVYQGKRLAALRSRLPKSVSVARLSLLLLPAHLQVTRVGSKQNAAGFRST